MSYLFDDDKAVTSSLMDLHQKKAHLLQGSAFASSHSLTWSGSAVHINKLGLAHQDGRDEYEATEGKEIIAPVGRVTFPLAITAAVTAFGSSFPHGWNTGVLNSPSRLIQDFLNETYTDRFGSVPSDGVLNLLWAASVAVYLIGGCAGAFSAGWFADKFGRKKALLICHVFGFVSAVLFGFCQMAGSFEMLIIARIIVGFGCGAGSGLVPMYLTEIAPINIRGAMGVLHQFALTCGILVSQILGLRQLLGNPTGWPILLALTAAPCVVSAIVLPFFPESPRYLFKEGKKDAAEKALKQFRGTDDVDLDMQEMKMEQEQQHEEESWSFMQLFRAKDIRMPMALICALACCQQLSGINAIFYYATSIFEASGIPTEKTQYAVLCTGVINVLMTGISVPLMEKGGRRPLLFIGMALMILAAAVLTAALATQHFLTWMSYVSIICVVLFVVGFAFGLGSIPQFIGAELFKQGPRPPAMSLAGFLNWLSNFTIGITYPSMQAALQSYSFLVFIVIIFVFGVFLFWKLPETKNKTYEDIYQIFQGKDKATQNGGVTKCKPGEKSVPAERETLLETNSNGVDFSLKSTGKSGSFPKSSAGSSGKFLTKPESSASHGKFLTKPESVGLQSVSSTNENNNNSTDTSSDRPPVDRQQSVNFSLRSTGKSSAGSFHTTENVA